MSRLLFEWDDHDEFRAFRLRVDGNFGIELLLESIQEPHAETFGLRIGTRY